MEQQLARPVFLTTERTAFSCWTAEDTELAALLWGDPAVSRYICARGVFTPEEIVARLALEIENRKRYGLQYWPVFDRGSGELAALLRKLGFLQTGTEFYAPTGLMHPSYELTKERFYAQG